MRIADSQRPRACRLGPARAGCTNKPNLPATPEGRSNPRPVAGNGVSVRKTQNTVSGICGILVFWYSGLAPRKTRFGGAGTICIWHVARGGLAFWGKNKGHEGTAGKEVAEAGGRLFACPTLHFPGSARAYKQTQCGSSTAAYGLPAAIAGQLAVPGSLQRANQDRAPKRGSMCLGTEIDVPGRAQSSGRGLPLVSGAQIRATMPTR